jgi:glucose/mannose-6-phosphate isomerase
VSKEDKRYSSMRGLNLKDIRKIDKKDMLGFLMDFPQQCEMALEIANQVEFFFTERDFNKIIFAGMGGSAIGADLIRSYLYENLDLPVMVFREYNLPAFIDKRSLVFISSYSGNTEESLSCYQQAKERKFTLIAISSGGKLKELCLKDKNTFIQIPSGFPPRCALGYLSLIPLRVLERMGIIKLSMEKEYREMISVLNELKSKSLNPHIAKEKNPAKYLALKIFNKIPLLYTSSLHFDVVAVRFRAQLNENAKTLALSNLLPEMNHNEIEGFKNIKKLIKYLVAIFLIDSGIHPHVQKRIEITQSLIKDCGIPVFEIHSRGDYLLSRLFSLIYTVDFVSFYLAILYNTDPTPVEKISLLKEKLKE